MDQPSDNPALSQAPGLSNLAIYAREVVRTYLAAMSESLPEGKPDPWAGIRIPAEKVARQFRQEYPELLDEQVKKMRATLEALLDGWLSDPPPDFYRLAELKALFKLKTEEIEIFIIAAAPAIDPAIQELYSFIWNNVQKKCADIGFVCQLLSRGQKDLFESYLQLCDFDAPLRQQRLIVVEPRQTSEDALDKNLTGRRVRAADRVLQFLRHSDEERVPPVDEALAATCTRIRKRVDIDSLRLDDYTRDTLLQVVRGGNLPAIFEGPAGAGKREVAQALATMFGKGLVAADLTALVNLLPSVLEVRLFELLREAHLGNDLLYFEGHDLPDHVAGATQMLLERVLGDQELVLGVDKLPLWMVSITEGWPVVSVPLPAMEHRFAIWKAAFTEERRAPNEDALEIIARRYEMSPDQIRQAATEARRRAVIDRRRRIELNDLDKACRSHFAHQLGEVASIIPPATFKPSDLILPPREKEVFDEILLYSREHDTIYSEWGFSEKFPYGRGLSVLFYGPPGTGKTMAACIIANVLGLDLYRVDLSRIMSRYVGETEKNLARVFDQAERGRAMLLFDEADALFTKRTAVKSSVDRYANLEVAYLLQRMENFEGVTVLTTNEEGNLDDAFKRRIRYRVYFPMPDGDTRGKLWRSLIPEQAPVIKHVPFELLGEHFEISGGHIKQAVLRAAFYARRDDNPISMEHLVEAGNTECRELGMLMSDKLPRKIENAIRKERGEPPLPEDSDNETMPVSPGPG